MRKSTGVVTAALLLACTPAAFALGSRIEDCTRPTGGFGLLDLHPEFAEACEAIIQVDGRRYLRMGAQLRQLHDEALVVRFNGSARDRILSPGAPESVIAAAESSSPTIPIGSALSVYVPEDRALEAFADASSLADAEVPVVVESVESTVLRIANYTCCPRRRPWYPIVDILPTTASPLPLMGLAGVGLLLIAAVLRSYRLWGR